MKKRVLIIGIIILIIAILVSYLCINNLNKRIILNPNDSNLAIMVENGNGSNKYEKWKQDTWPMNAEYMFNGTKSSCSNETPIKWDKETSEVYLESSKSEKCTIYFDKVIKIEFIEDLVDLSIQVNGGETLKGKKVVLTKNLDFKKQEDYKNPDNRQYNDINGDGIKGQTIYQELTEGAGFIPIGNGNNPFEGTFDGKNNTLSNILINNNKLSFVGLFGYIDSATIENITLDGIVTSNISANIGAFVGDAVDSKINECHNKATITSNNANEQNYNVGGLVGISSTGILINNSTNEGTVSGGNCVGGLIGLIDTEADVKISYTSNIGNITLINEALGDKAIGGLVGESGSGSKTSDN